MSRLLVTGGAGFIGSNFARYWRTTYPDDVVIVLDALTYAGNRANIADLEGSDKFLFVNGNILDQALVEELLRRHDIDNLVHFAAESHVDRSILGPDAFIEMNIVGIHSLLKAARRVWLEEWEGKRTARFHHVSTDEVYGTLGSDDPAFTETTPCAPNSHNAGSKAATDHLVRACMETYGLPVAISNCSNNYGTYHLPEKLIPLVIANILDDRSLPVYGDGLQIRDWLYVEGHCRGIDLILKSDKIGECFNIGGYNEWANIDIVRLICELMNEATQGEGNRKAFPKAASALKRKTENLITFVTD